MIAPFLAALANSAGIVIDKIAISKQKVPLKIYIPYLFLYLFFFSFLLTPFFGQVNWQLLLTPQFLFLFLVLILLALTWNIFYYDSLKKEPLFEFETIIMMAPLLTILLSWIFFPENWDIRVGGAALIAAAALVWSHWEKHHFTINHYSMNLLVAVVLMATEEIIVTEFLRSNIFSPVGLYALRTFILAAFFFAYYRPMTSKIDRTGLRMISLSGLLGAAFMVLKYYGFRDLGIPFTSLVTIAGPMAVYIASATVMHERMRFRVLIAAMIIATAIIYASTVIQIK